jgi:hypothetical protein
MASTLIVPKFATETEEADWWYANRDLVEQNFVAAAREGRLGHGTMMRRMEQRQAQLREEATIQLDDDDAAKARAAAERRGMPLQSFVKMLVHEALQQDEAGR